MAIVRVAWDARADNMGAADTDLGALAAELMRLEREEREVSALRRKLHERLASFANEQTSARERELSARRRLLHAEIDAARARLASLDGAAGRAAPSFSAPTPAT
jgi:hypothetical protein